MTSISYINRNWLEQEARKSFENHFPQYVRTANYGKYFDAYRHTYVSALLTREFGSNIADMIEIINEILGVSNTIPDHNQDLWNNRVGRELVGSNANITNEQIADLVANAINNGDCITDKNNDSRINDIVPEYQISEAIFTVEGVIKNWLNDLLESAQTINTNLQSAYIQFETSVNTKFRPMKDPLIIDGGNDGLELNSWQNSGVLFDLDGDGNAESSGWVKSSASGGDELFLALDKNGNGNIDSVEELFGNDTTGGFAQLSAYDSNHDNIINSSDNQLF